MSDKLFTSIKNFIQDLDQTFDQKNIPIHGFNLVISSDEFKDNVKTLNLENFNNCFKTNKNYLLNNSEEKCNFSKIYYIDSDKKENKNIYIDVEELLKDNENKNEIQKHLLLILLNCDIDLNNKKKVKKKIMSLKNENTQLSTIPSLGNFNLQSAMNITITEDDKKSTTNLLNNNKDTSKEGIFLNKIITEINNVPNGENPLMSLLSSGIMNDTNDVDPIKALEKLLSLAKMMEKK